ncbi:MAG: radical SAM family heme chaperone HemW [Sediminibacterium sp.]|nr:radical SAM family heme chaperone HemW [Sediminibacterium sp.]
MAGLYIHIPYCKKACNYCNFHFSTIQSSQAEMVKAIIKEIIFQKDLITTEIETIYFGGGTPSLLTPLQIENILNTIHKNYRISTQVECSFEANPDDLRVDTLSAWQQCGINRLSVGIQSLHNPTLEWMNRTHNAAEALKNVGLAKKYFSNLNLDVIYGIALVSHQDFEHSLRQILQLVPTHISAYALTIEPKTKLERQIKQNPQWLAPDEWYLTQRAILIDMLYSNSFEHYEVSNFSLKDYQSKHNSNYWLRKPYIGFGPAAHSFIKPKRWWNIANNSTYINQIFSNQKISSVEELTIQQQYNEYMMFAFRTAKGGNFNEIENLYGVQIKDHTKNKLLQINSNHININDDGFSLTTEGWLWSDKYAVDFFLE